MMGGKKGLYIYKPGLSAWQNVTEAVANKSGVTATFSEENVVIKATRNSNSYYYRLGISEGIYGKFEKLVFKAAIYPTSSKGGIFWASRIPASNAPIGGTQTALTTSSKEYSIDISGETGDRYIIIYPGGTVAATNYTITIYDMHFE